MPGRLILSLTVYKDYLVRLERENGLPRIVIRHLATGEEHAIAFDEEAYSLGMIDGYEFDTTTLRFTYSSMTTPARVYDYDMATRDARAAQGGGDPLRPRSRRLRDAAGLRAGRRTARRCRSRCSIAADTPLDGSAPCLLYGYGAYGISMPAAFGTTRLSLVDRGFVYAIAHVRGGKDKGYRWYADGRREKKTNTFTDFIAGGRVSGRRRSFTAPRTHRRLGRLGRRPAHRRGRQHGAGPLRRHDRRGAVRRRAHHHARRHAAADAAGMAGMGQSDRERRGLPDHRLLFALRQRAAQAYPAILALGRPHRSARHLLGAGEVGGEAARDARPTTICSSSAPTWTPATAAPPGRFDRLHETAFATAFALKVAGGSSSWWLSLTS